jgi:hypothetical protein
VQSLARKRTDQFSCRQDLMGEARASRIQPA